MCVNIYGFPIDPDCGHISDREDATRFHAAWLDKTVPVTSDTPVAEANSKATDTEQRSIPPVHVQQAIHKIKWKVLT